MSVYLESLEDISNLTSINGLDMSVIEHRARKIADNTSDPEQWRYRSFDGFIGDNETLKERLCKDWETVHTMGYSHIQMANCLKQIITQTEKERSQKGRGPMSTMVIQFISPLSKQQPPSPQTLEVSRQCYNSPQYSLFFNSSPEKSTQPHLNTKWNEEYTVKNMANSLEIKIGGGLDGGLVQYIETYGFYEGDEKNAYRVDPHLVYAITTGDVTSEVRDILHLRELHQQELYNSELNEIRERMKVDSLSKEEKEWLQQQETKLLSIIQQNRSLPP